MRLLSHVSTKMNRTLHKGVLQITGSAVIALARKASSQDAQGRDVSVRLVLREARSVDWQSNPEGEYETASIIHLSAGFQSMIVQLSIS